MVALRSVPTYSVCFLFCQSPPELEVKLTLVTADENTNCLWMGCKEWEETTEQRRRHGRETALFVL